MNEGAYSPEQVIPTELAEAVRHLPFWFVIGGHAVRSLVPYRPSRDVDFGVNAPEELDTLITELSNSGEVEISERAGGTAHFRWNGINVSVFVLPLLQPYVVDRRLGTTGILATKLHAILDRGTRRDFFDLYVTLQSQRLGVLECLRSIRQVYRQDVNEGLLLRALTYFADADLEAPLPGEGPHDWKAVKEYFMMNVGSLLVPPDVLLEIQSNRVDVTDYTAGGSSPG